MSRSTVRMAPLLGVLSAIAITTTMDATGFLAFSALPLFPLMGLFWYLQGFPRRVMGFVWSQWSDYGLAFLYPVVVLGLIALISTAAGVINLSETHWGKAWLNIMLVSASTILVAIVTEEGFF